MTATPGQKTTLKRSSSVDRELCESLAENYKMYHRRMIESNVQRFNADGERQDLSEYAQKQLDALNDGTFKGMRFVITTGKKYHKIISKDWDDRLDDYRSGGVHAFVDKKTGEITNQHLGDLQQSTLDMI